MSSGSTKSGRGCKRKADCERNGAWKSSGRQFRSSPTATRTTRLRLPTIRPMACLSSAPPCIADPGETSGNLWRLETLSPFGRCKQSGIGREYGSCGLEAFLEPRALAAKRVTSAAAADQSAAGASQRRSASLSDIYPVAFQRPPSEIRPFLLSATIGFNQPMPNREGLRDG